jgi:hypothetical protein
MLWYTLSFLFWLACILSATAAFIYLYLAAADLRYANGVEDYAKSSTGSLAVAVAGFMVSGWAGLFAMSCVR